MYSNGYKYRKTLTIDRTKVSAFFGYYRMLVLHTDADLKSVANGGKVELNPLLDIRFEDMNGVKLNHEVVEYNPATGSIEAWVRIGFDTVSQHLSTTVDTPIQMYFGKQLSAQVINGLPVGFASGWVAFQRNWDRNGAAENQGEVAPFISAMTDPTGATITQPNTAFVTGKEDSTGLISGYIMYSATPVQSRFGVDPAFNDRMVLIYWNGSTWVVENNGSTLVPFTPQAGDFIVAAAHWGQEVGTGRAFNYVAPLRAGEELAWATWGDLDNGISDIGVVGNNSRAVFHFNESPGGTNVYNVASSDRFAMNMSGSGQPTSTTGKVGKALNYNGSNYKLRSPWDVIWSTLGHGYMSVWIRPAELTSNGAIFARRANTSTANQLTMFKLGASIRLDNGSFQWTTGYNLPAANQWYNLVWIANGSQHKLMVNGVVVATRNTTDGFAGGNDYNRVQFGASQTDAGSDGNWFNGQIDEFILTVNNVGDGHHVTNYNNTNNPGTFYSVGVLQTALAVDNSSHGLTSGEVNLIENKTLSVATAIHAVNSNEVILVENKTLAIQRALHGVQSAQLTLTQKHVLTVLNAIHGLTSTEIPEMEEGEAVVPNSATHGLTSDNIQLFQRHILTINNTSHGLYSDNIALNQFILMGQPDTGVFGHSVGDVILVQDHKLVVDSVIHAIRSTILDIVNWDELGVHFGTYKPKYGANGELESVELEDNNPYKPGYGTVGQITLIEIEQPGLYKPDYKDTGRY